jgi:transcriptional regulator with XRE-family HTH domain
MYDKRLSARETARRAGISNSMVSQYAREHVHPTFDAAARLALVLDFSLDEVASHLEIDNRRES